MSVTSLRNRRVSVTRLEVLPKFSAERLCTVEGSPTDPSPVSPPSVAHIQETSPHISGYLDFVPQQSYSQSTTPGSAFTSTAVSRKTSVDNLTTAAAGESASPVPSTNTLERFPLRISCAFFVYFLCGWGDGVTGTVLPKFRQDLGIGYTQSSLFFVAGTVGYSLGTLAIETLLSFFGRLDLSLDTRQLFQAFILKLSREESGILRFYANNSQSKARARLLIFGSISHALFFVILGSEPRFETALIAFAVAAFARALLTGALNAYVNSHPKKSLGQLHGAWAVGAFFSPLVCQSLMSKGVPWRNFYLGSLVLSALNTFFLAFAFSPTPSELSEGSDQTEHSANTDLPSPVYSTATPSKSTLRLALAMPLVWAFSIFQAIYAGSETVTQGYIVIYLLGEKAADPLTVGYVSSGFWAGMSISRIGVGFLYPRLSFRHMKLLLHMNLFIALVMHVLVWVVPSFAADALFTGIIGVVYGPVFPIGMALLTQLIPPEVHMISMAINSTFGSIGNAIFPFTAGILSNDVSVKTYSYILVVQGVVLVILWGLLPSQRK